MAVFIPTMPQPSDDALDELSATFGRPLPPSYINFVRHHNGARPDSNTIATLNNEVSVSRFIPVEETRQLAMSIEGFPTNVIPLAEDDCGNYFYVVPQTGAVHFWDHEVEHRSEQIATNVSQFTERLTPFDPSQVKLAPGQVKRVWVNPAFKPEF